MNVRALKIASLDNSDVNPLNNSSFGKKDVRYRPFGVFRFILALMVVVSHTSRLGGEEIEAAMKPWGVGNVAVMVFFCLSGYVIAEALDCFYRNKVGRFLLNRALRVVPPYFTALIFSVLVHYCLHLFAAPTYFDYDSQPAGMFSAHNLLSNILLIGVLYGLGNIGLAPDYPFVRYVWAVRVEIHFYLVYAVTCFLVSWSRLTPALRRTIFPATFIACSGLFGLALWTRASFLNYFSFAPYFMLGVSMYYALQRRNNAAKWVALVSLSMSVGHFLVYSAKSDTALLFWPACLMVTLIAVIAVLSRFAATSSLIRIDQAMGDLSYPLYLNHYAASVIMLSLMPIRSPGVFLLCAIFCVAVSWGVSQTTEPFTRKLRDAIRGRVLR